MLRRFQEAEPLLHEVIARTQSMSMPDDERVAWEQLGLLYEQQGKYDEACTYYYRALTGVEASRSALAAETHRIGFLATREGPPIRLARLLALGGRLNEGWDVCERARSRSFVDILARAEIRPPDVLPAPLVQAERDWLGVLRRNEVELKQPDARHTAGWLSDLVRARDRLRKVWSEMAPLAPEYVALRRGDTISWNDVRSLLQG